MLGSRKSLQVPTITTHVDTTEDQIVGNAKLDTYTHVDTTEDQIVENAKLDILKFRIRPSIKEEKLALLYQTPKFHKNPPKMRYIAGNVNTVTSSLDATVALILKMVKTHFRNFCKKTEEFANVRYYFDVQTSMEVKGMFSRAYGEALTISINDFSTMTIYWVIFPGSCLGLVRIVVQILLELVIIRLGGSGIIQ